MTHSDRQTAGETTKMRKLFITPESYHIIPHLHFHRINSRITTLCYKLYQECMLQLANTGVTVLPCIVVKFEPD